MSIRAIAWALKQKTGNHTSKLVLIKLADNANDDGVCWPSLRKVCEHTELSERSVRENIRKLEEAGFVKTERRCTEGVNLPNVYFLAVDTVQFYSGVGRHMPQGGAPHAGGVGRHVPPNLKSKPSIEPFLPSVSVPDGTSPPERLPLREAIEAYNEAAVKSGWPVAKKLANGRRVNLCARLREHGIAAWSDSMMRASSSDFLTGKASRSAGHESWTPDLGFFAKAENFTKLIEGRYDNRHAPQATPLISREKREEIEQLEAENRKRMGLS